MDRCGRRPAHLVPSRFPEKLLAAARILPRPNFKPRVFPNHCAAHGSLNCRIKMITISVSEFLFSLFVFADPTWTRSTITILTSGVTLMSAQCGSRAQAFSVGQEAWLKPNTSWWEKGPWCASGPNRFQLGRPVALVLIQSKAEKSPCPCSVVYYTYFRLGDRKHPKTFVSFPSGK